MNNTRSSSKEQIDEDKRIRRLYQTLLERRPLKYWSILDFPYLAEIVRHDSSYLRRILNFVFVDHPALSRYLTLIAWKELSKEINSSEKHNAKLRVEVMPIGFERTLWIMYRRQKELSDLWASKSESETISCDVLPGLNSMNEFTAKLNGSL